MKEKIQRYNLPFDIISFADNNKNLHGKLLWGIPIIAPKDIMSLEYDHIIISPVRPAFLECITEQLTKEYGILSEKIDSKFVFSTVFWEARFIALRNTAQNIISNGVKGEVAELGVFQGEFARHINKQFSDRKLYLFDTFDGFSTDDIEKDIEIGSTEKILDEEYNFSGTTEEYVLDRMEYPENCIIKKGYFPKTAEGLEERYAFVSLDADLYQPMYEGLKYFYPRLEKGGYIFVHDFYNEDFIGTRKAVMEYNNKIEKLHYVPLGDSYSVGIMK
ncbi:MAG: TylF/MycF family methyltransferase [Treponema sp.]|nr:TylF/MycF family methyltransferase [Treponema sp.]